MVLTEILCELISGAIFKRAISVWNVCFGCHGDDCVVMRMVCVWCRVWVWMVGGCWCNIVTSWYTVSYSRDLHPAAVRLGLDGL